MSKIINGKLIDAQVHQKIYAKLHKGGLTNTNAIVIHQTGAPSAQHTFNSYLNANHGAHFLIDKKGRIYQTALTNQVTYHVGRLKSRCLQTKQCSAQEISAANAIYLKKGVSYSIRVKNLHAHEKAKAYPQRFPSNSDSIGIEIVGAYNVSNQSYESVTPKQNTTLKWLVDSLRKHLNLQSDDIYRHPDISYKQPSEASTASW